MTRFFRRLTMLLLVGGAMLGAVTASHADAWQSPVSRLHHPLRARGGRIHPAPRIIARLNTHPTPRNPGR